MAYIQDDIDTMVDTLVDHEIRLANIAATLKKQNDPVAFERENEVMMLQNLIYALRDYQLADDILSETEIRVTYEMGLQISLNWQRS